MNKHHIFCNLAFLINFENAVVLRGDIVDPFSRSVALSASHFVRFIQRMLAFTFEFPFVYLFLSLGDSISLSSFSIEHLLFSFVVFFALLRVRLDGLHDGVVRLLMPFLFSDFLGS